MPEGVGYGPQNTGSTGLTLNYIGSHCYAFSGDVNTSGSSNPIAILDFTTGSHYINAKIMFGLNHDTTDNLGFRVVMNGENSAGYEITGGVGDAQASNWIPFLIPPYSHIQCTIQNDTDSSAVPVHCHLVGRVYGKIE